MPRKVKKEGVKKAVWRGWMLPAALALAALAVAVYLLGLRADRAHGARVAVSSAWPAVAGQVVESRGVDEWASDDEGNEIASYYLLLRYTYSVDGVQYTGERYGWKESLEANSMAQAEIFAGRYPPGSQVTLYVDPAEPSLALIDPAYGADDWGPGIFYYAGSGLLAAFAAIPGWKMLFRLGRLERVVVVAGCAVLILGGGLLTVLVNPVFAFVAAFGFASLGAQNAFFSES